MARPKTVSDAAVLDAATLVIGQLGPAAFTLRDVAAKVGLSPATIIQRFGTKRGLLIALATYRARKVDDWFERARFETERPIDTLVHALVKGAKGLTKDGAAAQNLAFLQFDLTDPDLCRHTLEFFHAVRVNIHALLEEAVAAGALEPVDTEALARAIEALYHGTLLVWAVEPKEKADEVLRRSLALLLGPRV
jgi:AcrR family transcriptional regulator